MVVFFGLVGNHVARAASTHLCQLRWFRLATLVDIRSPEASRCLIRRWNRRQSVTLTDGLYEAKKTSFLVRAHRGVNRRCRVLAEHDEPGSAPSFGRL